MQRTLKTDPVYPVVVGDFCVCVYLGKSGTFTQWFISSENQERDQIRPHGKKCQGKEIQEIHVM